MFRDMNYTYLRHFQTLLNLTMTPSLLMDRLRPAYLSRCRPRITSGPLRAVGITARKGGAMPRPVCRGGLLRVWNGGEVSFYFHLFFLRLGWRGGSRLGSTGHLQAARRHLQVKIYRRRDGVPYIGMPMAQTRILQLRRADAAPARKPATVLVPFLILSTFRTIEAQS